MQAELGRLQAVLAGRRSGAIRSLKRVRMTTDLMPKGGTYDGKTLLGIVKVDGDALTIAFAEPGKERPTKFESAAGSGVVLAVHKKAK